MVENGVSSFENAVVIGKVADEWRRSDEADAVADEKAGETDCDEDGVSGCSEVLASVVPLRAMRVSVCTLTDSDVVV